MTGTEPTRTEQTARATREARAWASACAGSSSTPCSTARLRASISWSSRRRTTWGEAATTTTCSTASPGGGRCSRTGSRSRSPARRPSTPASSPACGPSSIASGAPFHSDHLCFGEARRRAPRPPAGRVPARGGPAHRRRVRRVADALGRPVAVENISYYLHPGVAEMTEADFLAELCEAADCGLMLDVNNAYVNATNFGFDVDAWMARAPLERVVRSRRRPRLVPRGHGEPVPAPRTDAERRGALIVDTHGADVPDPVLALLSRVLRRTGDVPVPLERDQAIPELPALLDELSPRPRRARRRPRGAPVSSAIERVFLRACFGATSLRPRRARSGADREAGVEGADADAIVARAAAARALPSPAPRERRRRLRVDPARHASPRGRRRPAPLRRDRGRPLLDEAGPRTPHLRDVPAELVASPGPAGGPRRDAGLPRGARRGRGARVRRRDGPPRRAPAELGAVTVDQALVFASRRLARVRAPRAPRPPGRRRRAAVARRGGAARLPDAEHATRFFDLSPSPPPSSSGPSRGRRSARRSPGRAPRRARRSPTRCWPASRGCSPSSPSAASSSGARPTLTAVPSVRRRER